MDKVETPWWEMEVWQNLVLGGGSSRLTRTEVDEDL